MDMGKNTLHKIGLDSSGTILLREKVSRGRITSPTIDATDAQELALVLDDFRGERFHQPNEKECARSTTPRALARLTCHHEAHNDNPRI
jgi:hypothetical protein